VLTRKPIAVMLGSASDRRGAYAVPAAAVPTAAVPTGRQVAFHVAREATTSSGQHELRERLLRFLSEGDRLRYLWLFLIAAALAVLASARHIMPVFHGELPDPDSFMRLVRLEQGLKLGHLVNVVQGDDSGLALVIEWSRLFDAAIVALAAPLAPFVGWHRALFAAGVATGPISVGLLGALLGFAVAPLTRGRFLWAAAMVAPLLPGIREFATFGVIHYHIAQVVLVALMAGCVLRATAGDRAWALGAGISGGFAIWMMPETMPWVLLAEAGLGWAWLFRPIGGAVMLSGIGFFATILGGLAIDPPDGGILAVEIDHLSIVYAALGLAVLATGCVLALLDRARISPTQRTVVAIATALAAFVVWLACYPSVALGPYALMSPQEMLVFFGQMAETQPVHGIGAAIALLGPGLMGSAYAVWRIWHGRAALPAVGSWILVAIGILFATGLTARFIIFQQYPAALAAGLLPIALCEVSTRFATRPNYAAFARIGLIACLVLVPMFGRTGVASFSRNQIESATPQSCALRDIASLVAPAARRIVLTRPDAVPELLYRTEIIAVGSLYQHGIDAYLRAWTAWRTPLDGAAKPAAIVASRAEFVLFCPDGQSDALAATAPAGSLWASLVDGRPPPWLTLVGEQGATGFRLYRIAP